MWDFISEYVLPIFLVILIILAIIIITGITIGVFKTGILNQDEYIQNLEEKLNIYEQSYDNYCLEDALRQQEE